MLETLELPILAFSNTVKKKKARHEYQRGINSLSATLPPVTLDIPEILVFHSRSDLRGHVL